MAADPWVIFLKNKHKFSNGQIDFDSHTFKLALLTSTYSPDINNNEFFSGAGGISTGNEIAALYGYISGGISLSNITFLNTSGVVKFSCDSIELTVTGGNITGILYGAIYDSTVSGGPLICYSRLKNDGGTITVNDGQVFKITIPSNGIFTY